MGGTVNREVRVYPDLESLSREVAKEIIHLAQAAIAERGRFTLVLGGGETPRTLYRLLARESRKQVPWSQVHLFWGDERYVPPDHPESNFAMAYETLISKVPLPPQNIHRILTEIEPPEKAAEVYEQLLQEFFKGTSPTLDVALLGVGEDGHTASLFPDDPVLKERKRWVRAVLAPPTSLPRWRITPTLPGINRANFVFFLVSGARKRATVQAILEAPEVVSNCYPAAMVRPEGRVV